MNSALRAGLRPVLLALIGVALASPVVVHAADKGRAAASNQTGAAEERVRKNVEAMVGPGNVSSVRRAGYGDFYEVITNDGSIAYSDGSGSYLFTGQLIDLKARKNVTQAREQELSRINLADLPLNQAIKQVRGNGKRTLVTFEDPNCGFCKKLAKDVTGLKDTTVYTFLIPILSPDSETKSRNIWCAPDRAKAWNDWMVENKTPPTYTCDTPLKSNSEIANRLRIRGTPTMFLADGNRIGGYVALNELDKAISDAEAAARK